MGNGENSLQNISFALLTATITEYYVAGTRNLENFTNKVL